MTGAAILCVEVDSSRIERRLETRYLDEVADSLDDAVAGAIRDGSLVAAVEGEIGALR